MSFSVNYIANKSLDVETKEKTLGIDLQRIDTKSLENNEEYLPVKSTKIVKELIRDYEIRNNTQHQITLDLSVVEMCKNIDFVIRHDLDEDLRVAFRYVGSSYGNEIGDGLHGVIKTDGSIVAYGVASNQAYHIVKPFYNINLSQTAMSVDVDSRSVNPFKFMHPFNDIQLLIRAESSPTTGGVSVTLIGDTI